MNRLNIAEKIEAAIGEMIPTYYDIADFGDNAPEKYVLYEFTEKGAEYGEGISHGDNYMVTLNIFTPALDMGLYQFIKAAMQAAGFSYSGGGNAMTDTLFPYTKHWYQDYGYVGDVNA